jgi:hypothetical protein
MTPDLSTRKNTSEGRAMNRRAMSTASKSLGGELVRDYACGVPAEPRQNAPKGPQIQNTTSSQPGNSIKGPGLQNFSVFPKKRHRTDNPIESLARSSFGNPKSTQRPLNMRVPGVIILGSVCFSATFCQIKV